MAEREYPRYGVFVHQGQWYPHTIESATVRKRWGVPGSATRDGAIAKLIAGLRRHAEDTTRVMRMLEKLYKEEERDG